MARLVSNNYRLKPKKKRQLKNNIRPSRNSIKANKQKRMKALSLKSLNLIGQFFGDISITI